MSVLRRAAFTLIELLVVVSLIVLLIALLLPALKRVRDVGRAAQCASHMRSLASAATDYTVDNVGRFPFVHWTNGDGYPPEMVPNADAPVSAYSLPWSNYAWVYLGRQSELLKCPSSPESTTHPQLAVTEKGQILADYPPNGYVTGFGGKTSVTLRPVPIRSVQKPSYTFLFVDGAFIALESYRDFPWMMGRHMESMNAAHVDGHVESHMRLDTNYSDNQFPGGNMGSASFSNEPDRLHATNAVWHMGPNGIKPPWPNGEPYPY